jgi:hypothetical protein
MMQSIPNAIPQGVFLGNMMTTFQSVTPSEATVMALSWGMGFAELTNAQKADRDWKLAASLDKKGDEYFAAGNLAMAKVCRERALNSANRAVRFSA